METLPTEVIKKIICHTCFNDGILVVQVVYSREKRNRIKNMRCTSLYFNTVIRELIRDYWSLYHNTCTDDYYQLFFIHIVVDMIQRISLNDQHHVPRPILASLLNCHTLILIDQKTITDEVLRALPSLLTLELIGITQITAKGIAQCTNLTSLWLKVPLHEAEISNDERLLANALGNLHALTKLKLINVTPTSNPHLAVDDLQPLTNLRTLSLHYSPLHYVKSLTSLVRLTSLSVSHPLFETVEVLNEMTQLKRLKLKLYEGNDIEQHFSRLTQLVSLSLHRGQLPNVDLSYMTRLNCLSIQLSNRYYDHNALFNLSRLVGLVYLNIDCAFNLLYHVKYLTNLKVLDSRISVGDWLLKRQLTTSISLEEYEKMHLTRFTNKVERKRFISDIINQ